MFVGTNIYASNQSIDNFLNRDRPKSKPNHRNGQNQH